MTTTELKAILKSEILNEFHDFLDNVKEQNEDFRKEIISTVSKIERALESNYTLLVKEVNLHEARIAKLEKESRDNYGVLSEIKASMATIAKYNPAKMVTDIDSTHTKIRSHSTRLKDLEEAPGIKAITVINKVKWLVVGALVSGLIAAIYGFVREVLK